MCTQFNMYLLVDEDLMSPSGVKTYRDIDRSPGCRRTFLNLKVAGILTAKRY